MQLNNIRAPRGVNKRKKIVGRGKGSGMGKTSCRGENGQGSRAGRVTLRGFEGGQISLIRRLPKVGFRNPRPVLNQVVTINDLAAFPKGTKVDGKLLKQKGIIKKDAKPYKILGDGELKHALAVAAYAFSATAKEKITKAGGSIEVITGAPKIEKEEKK